MTVIPETCRAHYNIYLCFFLLTGIDSTRHGDMETNDST